MAFSAGKMKIALPLLRNYYIRFVQLSTATFPLPVDVPRFRTSENNPSLHTSLHIGKYYKMDNDVKQRLFFNGGIPKKLDTQMKTFQENCLMVREPFLEIRSILERINFNHPAVRFVIYGRDGTGKTTTLMHLVHYGYVTKYLLLHQPWVSIWTKRPKEVVASQSRDGMIDLPVESTNWLLHFKLQNEELLRELDLRTSESYSWSLREVTEKGEPLLSVLEHGLQRVGHSSDCVAVLLKEIKHQSQFGKFKVMVVADGVNAFWAKTNVRRPDKSTIPCEEITIAKAFMKVLKNDWNNAVIITSVDILPYNRAFSMLDPYTPRQLLGKEGFELLDPFIPIHTTKYSEKEIDSVIDYYMDRCWIQSEKARTEIGRKQFKFLSGYNPGELMKVCDPV